MIKQKNETNKRISFTALVTISVLVILSISAFLKVITPQKEKVVANDFALKNYDQTKSFFKKISFSGNAIIVPETFNLYKSQNSSGLSDALADRIIKGYDLLPDEKIPNYWVGTNNSLIKNNYDQNYVFNSATSKEDSKEYSSIIAEEAISICLNFYKKYNLVVPLIPQRENIIYLNTSFEQNIVEPKLATFLQIPLTYELDGYKVFLENKNDFPFFCRVNNFYELERITFRDFFEKFDLIKQLPSITVDQAVSNIKSGTSSIISAESKIVSSIDLNWINEADLYSVEIDYRYDDVLKIVYPFYKFRAKLTNSAGINIQATIITPAIATATEQ